MRMTPRVIVKKLIRRWSISSSARCCDRQAFLMISWFTTMSQKNVSDNGSDWRSDTTRRRHPCLTRRTLAQLRTINHPSSKYAYTKLTPKHIHHHYAPSVTLTHTTHAISSTTPTYAPHCYPYIWGYTLPE